MHKLAKATLALCGAASLVVLPATRDATTREARNVTAVTRASSYLALGDSVTFGTEDPGVKPAPDCSKASSFVAYPELLGHELHLGVVNASCPGETSASLIDPSAQSLGCENNVPGSPAAIRAYRKRYPLHVSYSGSQLQFAVRYLRAHPAVSLVSLMIGANDLFLCVLQTHDECASPSEQRAAETKLTDNVRRILTAIRENAHYAGQIAIVNYYSTDYASAPESELPLAANRTVDAAAKPFDVKIANGYRTFETATAHFGGHTCAAGLLTRIGKPGDCGIHPCGGPLELDRGRLVPWDQDQQVFVSEPQLDAVRAFGERQQAFVPADDPPAPPVPRPVSGGCPSYPDTEGGPTSPPPRAVRGHRCRAR